MATRTVHPKLKVGDTFGGTEIIGPAAPFIGPSGTRFRRWTCRCSCGNEYVTYDSKLKDGKATDCGCRRAYVPPKNGTKFGKLEVLGIAPKTDRYNRVTCRCECGVTTDVLSFCLTSGSSKSCGSPGCREPMSEESKARIGAANRTHGKTQTPEYMAWSAMLNRCLNPTNEAYENYGGRGITVCDEWKTSFEAFFAHMGNRPSSRHSLDRVDNEKGYSPENCEWRPVEIQNLNKRNTVWVDWRGVRITLSEAAQKAGVNYYTAHERIFRLGWEVDRALTAPTRKVKQRDRDPLRCGADSG